MTDFLPTVKDVLDTVRTVYMNDPSGVIFTDSRLMPLLKHAYEFLEMGLERNGVQCKNMVSDPIVVPTGATTFPRVPADMWWPVKMEERLKGSSDLFIAMVNRRWNPSVFPTDKLIYWTWNSEAFQFLGATTDREVLLYYWRHFPAINSVDDKVLGKSETFLREKTAALAHAFISQNMTLAQVANEAAESELEEIINIFVKKQMPVRRKPYIPFR